MSYLCYNFLKKKVGFVLKSTGDKIKDLRKEKGLTQADLAQLSNLSIKTIQRFEYGNSPSNLRSLKKIADALGVDVDSLLIQTYVTPQEDDKTIDFLEIDYIKSTSKEIYNDLIDGLEYEEIEDTANYMHELSSFIQYFPQKEGYTSIPNNIIKAIELRTDPQYIRNTLHELKENRTIVEYILSDISSFCENFYSEKRLLSSFNELSLSGKSKIIIYAEDLVNAEKYKKTPTTGEN